MDAVMKELFTTDIGLLALFTLSFIVGMGLFLWYRLSKYAQEKQ
ncbi:MAG: DUF3149 domain-containing protein [Betaproteobacteria bacterium]|nr:DUF3149 domain-containing protein [Betaproteobacteria bacterium]